jgi:hypothetical protein
MQWTSYLPSAPDTLSRIEWWLWFGVAFSAIVTAIVGFLAWEVGRHRTKVEKESLQGELWEALEERDVKAKQLEEMIADAEKRAARLESKQAPRRLTPTQRKQISELLKGVAHAKVVVTAVLGDGEAIRYANDLVEALGQAGWTVDGVNQAVYAPNNPVGLLIRVKDKNNPPQGTIEIGSAIKKVGLQIAGAEVPSTAPDIIEIVVGNKP